MEKEILFSIAVRGLSREDLTTLEAGYDKISDSKERYMLKAKNT